MITLIEARSFRCLRQISQPLNSFHVLVAANASGKSTFLDVIAFLGDIAKNGPDYAVRQRTQTFQDLIWNRANESFELAVEAGIPDALLAPQSNGKRDTIRYEIAVGLDPDSNEISITSEKAILKPSRKRTWRQPDLFPEGNGSCKTILTVQRLVGSRTILSKNPDKHDCFYSEVTAKPGKGWVPAFRLGPRKSTLANLPEDESRFPVSAWFKHYLTEAVRRVVLDSQQMRLASPPGLSVEYSPRGHNLPWVIEPLRKSHPEHHKRWIDHLRTALPAIRDVATVERADDKHRYLTIEYVSGLKVPSWSVSDGTLRLLALTLPANLPDFDGIYLIEEPENGVHPRAVESIVDSLTSLYSTQVLLATHSPVIMSCVEPDQVLCFAKTELGETDIVLGKNHPNLKAWRGEENLSVLFAAGVLDWCR